jgi:hypothetical protein
MTHPPAATRLGLELRESEIPAVTDAAMKAILNIPGLAVLHADTSLDFWKQVAGRISYLLEDLINLPLADVLGAAWRTDRQLIEYCDGSPDKQTVVQLVDHEIFSRNQPYVELIVDGAKLGFVSLQADLRVLVEGASLTIQSSRITRANVGMVRIAAKVQIGGTPLLERKVVFAPPEVHFGDGILIGAP